MAFIIKAPQPRQPQPRHDLPTTPAHDPDAETIILGTVREVRNWSVLLWDCPEQRWYSLSSQAQADLMKRCRDEQIKIRVTVKGNDVKGIQI